MNRKKITKVSVLLLVLMSILLVNACGSPEDPPCSHIWGGHTDRTMTKTLKHIPSGQYLPVTVFQPRKKCVKCGDVKDTGHYYVKDTNYDINDELFNG